MIHRIAKELQLTAINTKLVAMSSFGDITLYDNKSIIKYPYVNIDTVNCLNRGGAKVYTFRIYVCDRNEPYTAYNKTETILDNFLNNSDLQVNSYTTNFFSYNFQDDIHGVWTDIQLEYAKQLDCIGFDIEGIITENLKFITTEDGDYIKTEDNLILKNYE